MSDFHPYGLWSLLSPLATVLEQGFRELTGMEDMILLAEVLAVWFVLSIGLDLVEAAVVRVRRDDEQVLPGRR
jgi:hypothetical protein